MRQGSTDSPVDRDEHDGSPPPVASPARSGSSARDQHVNHTVNATMRVMPSPPNLNLVRATRPAQVDLGPLGPQDGVD